MADTLQAREKNEDVHKRVEELAGEEGRKSRVIREAIHNHINSPEVWSEKIEEAERERDRLMEEKQRIERELERQRDKLTDLKDRRQEAKTLRKIERQVSDGEFDRTADIIRQHKYDDDPRSMTESEILRSRARKQAEEHGFEEEMVLKVYRRRVNV